MEDSRAEISKLRSVIDALLLKHKEMSVEIGTARDLQSKDQSEIKRLAGMYTLRLNLHLIDVVMQIGCLLNLACQLTRGSIEDLCWQCWLAE